jgi:uncharacterized protein (TIGR02271 family)
MLRHQLEGEHQMISQDQLGSLVGTTAYDTSGDKIGKIGGIYYDDQTDQPKWVTVHTGLFGTNQTFVPVQGAELGGDRVTLAYDKAKVKDAPTIAEEGHLSPQQEQQLYRYYGLDYGAGDDRGQTAGRAGGIATGGQYASGQYASGQYTRGDQYADDDTAVDVGRHAPRDRAVDGDEVDDDVAGRAVGRDTSGPTTDEAMTRSEEQLRVGTQTRETGRARLRKHVVTEQQQVSVPMSHDEVTVEREPITDANRDEAYAGPAISEQEHEVTLRAERPVVDTEAVPVERVRLGKQTVTDQEMVGGEVRKEEIELDKGDDDRGGNARDRQ